ncbi:asparagine synthase (glutamine-hydrolyzing) [Mucilaginibacter achroorhodeus]|uniref:asparagine synthase (glutamine-hydrolyzing) n=1 Tax=Mucilaginibacter achroorhodeus TaxID=2599294 RepID=A0A563U9H9_9SPHI|nr:asparagine synthase (glutamine-hydrolyzing) [Mucilaginibacter achroorhodeus]TWR27943.1 asparagine synthase (glutamine-hydrolyzing) [Mucilaginibacter achroorhodeus]
MCRIAGLVNPLSTGTEKYKVKAMCDALRHGGPDDEGIYASNDGGVIFGHRRLSIIDLSANGHQPMSDTHDRAVITFNGEIYNYIDLKQELLTAGATFKTNSDTEVILQAYLKWNTSAFGKLRGMFAFALHDVISGDVYLVRDTAGIKPLYYHIEDKQLAFASEVKAFKAGDIAHANNHNWPVYLLAYGHLPEPYTTLQNVYSLPNGHYLHWQQSGAYSIKGYTTDKSYNRVNDKEEAKNGINATFRSAIKRQLIADAPIGVFLSGGVDSSLITLLAAKEVEQLKTVSIFFNEKQYDERAYQQAVLDKTKGDNFTYLVKQEEFEQNFAPIVKAMDMPTTDGINSWFISKYAREAGLKTVLSGIGGDELFGGYPSFDRIKYLSYLRKIPAGIMQLFNLAGSPGLKRLSYLSLEGDNADYLALRGLFSLNEISRLLNADQKEIEDILAGEGNSENLPYDKLKAAKLETGLYMQNQLLRDTDMMSMQHGLEVRVPFLDEDFAAYVESIDPHVRFADGNKQLLINSFNKLLPAAVWQRPKMGFTFPLQKWMAANKDICNADNYNSSFANKKIADFKAGKLHWARAFALYHTQKHV